MPMILFLVVIGAAAGLIATRMMRVETDLLTAIVIGIVGAFAGWVMLRFVLMMSGWVVLTAAAVGGAMALIWLWKTYIAK